MSRQRGWMVVQRWSGSREDRGVGAGTGRYNRCCQGVHCFRQNFSAVDNKDKLYCWIIVHSFVVSTNTVLNLNAL